MQSRDDPVTETLLAQAGAGNSAALAELVARHRSRLRHMVQVRLDPRLAPRVDPSDIVQEALLDAHQKLTDYLKTRPIPFYPWLRQLTWERMIRHIRHHMNTRGRSVLREEPLYALSSQESTTALASRLLSRASDPVDAAQQEEDRARVQRALEGLSEEDREILLLRFVEQLSTSETAAVLKIAQGTVGSRQFRALKRIKALLEQDSNDPTA